MSNVLVTPPPSKGVRIHINNDKESIIKPITRVLPTAIPCTSTAACNQAEDNEVTKRRLHLKDKWLEKAIDENLDAVEIAI